VQPQPGLEQTIPNPLCKPPQPTASAAIYTRQCSSDADHTRYDLLARGVERTSGIGFGELAWHAFTSVRA
jgi:hypothetical protein